MGLEERPLEQYDRVLEVIEAALLAPAPPHPDPTGNKLEIVCKKPAQTSLGVETLRRSTSPKTLPRAVLRPAREKETLHPAPVVSSTISADRWESKMRVLRRMARTAGMKFLRKRRRGQWPPLCAGHRFFDCRQRRVGLGSVGAAGLRHVGPAAAALAAERLGCHAYQIDRVVARHQVRRDADHHAGLAVFGHADNGDDAGAELLLAVIGKTLEILHLDAFDGARHQLDVADLAHTGGARR